MSNIGMMEGAYFVGRSELLGWVNDLLQLNYSKVEHCANGAAYCQIMDSMFPGEVNMSRVNFAAKSEYEYVKNYKVLQQFFDKKGIEKHVEVDKLTKGRPLDNLEFLQWIKAYWDRTHRDVDYNGAARRAACGKENSAPNEPAAAKKMAQPQRVNASKTETAASSAQRGARSEPTNSRPTSAKAAAPKPLKPEGTAGNQKMQEMQDEVSRLKLIVEDLEKERDFYFGKLRDIEITCQANEVAEAQPIVDKIQEILYATTEDFVSVDEAGAQ
jgi:RP/EB family microtubule-associated protein